MNEIVTQLIPLFLHGESDAKNMLGNALLHAIPGVYATGFGMIVSGDSSHTVTGVFMVFGLTLLIVRGLWKILASTIAHDLFSVAFHTISVAANSVYRRFSH
jgi:hypothetical protein